MILKIPGIQSGVLKVENDLLVERVNNEEKNLVNYFLDLVIKFSVDIFIVNFKDNSKNNSNYHFII